jgi:hypothetical protein
MNMNLNAKLNLDLNLRVWQHKGTVRLTTRLCSQGACVHPVLEDLASVLLLLPSEGRGRAQAFPRAHMAPQRVVIVLSVEAEIKL